MYLYVPEPNTHFFSTHDNFFVFAWSCESKMENGKHIRQRKAKIIFWVVRSVMAVDCPYQLNDYSFFSKVRFKYVSMMFSYWSSTQYSHPLFLCLSIVHFELSNKFYPHFNKFVKCQLNIHIPIVYYLFFLATTMHWNAPKKNWHIFQICTQKRLFNHCRMEMLFTLNDCQLVERFFFGEGSFLLRNSTMLVNSWIDKGVLCGSVR